MNPQLIIAAVIAACSFGGAWQIQSWRYAAKETDRVKQELEQRELQLEDQRHAARATVQQFATVTKAQDAATRRTAALHRDLVASRVVTDGLRNAADQAVRDAAASHSACIERATTLGESLVAVVRAGAELAEKADRHANDAITCHDAWPQPNSRP